MMSSCNFGAPKIRCTSHVVHSRAPAVMELNRHQPNSSNYRMKFLPFTNGQRMRCPQRAHMLLPRASSVQDVETWSTEKPSPYIKEKMDFLREDLTHLFDDQGIDQSAYDDVVEFIDPITKYGSAKGYMFNIAALRRVFDPDYVLHDLRQTGPYEVTTRWSMRMRLSINPIPKYWPGQMLFTGVSILGINPKNGRFNRHIDYWDAISDQAYFSLEAFAHVLEQLADVKRIPPIESPKYTVMKKTKQYEVRRYEPFLAAETDMQAASTSKGPATGESPPGVSGGGSAFNALAGYIFGGNERGEKMKMTTPVFTDTAGRMQFVIGSAYKDEASLPAPKSAAVRTVQRPGGLYGAVAFSGAVDDKRAQEFESRLRKALLADGIEPAGNDWVLARYNDPSTWPIFRRNEVLIPISKFDLWANNFPKS